MTNQDNLLWYLIPLQGVFTCIILLVPKIQSSSSSTVRHKQSYYWILLVQQKVLSKAMWLYYRAQLDLVALGLGPRPFDSTHQGNCHWRAPSLGHHRRRSSSHCVPGGLQHTSSAHAKLNMENGIYLIPPRKRLSSRKPSCKKNLRHTLE